mmetsp:Transcript_8720/g.21157  ORF Transcript_8720/g.21157 Transcript_8720/m.21157 type:complete len:171 (+) Transcript_8720:540-1052(+)|eukprot:CAMPEP_0178993142 /NCGR_PEP_ID=MMETSP0795-20121207/6531_1 /TAXON_ID=88552 /ORGANISM="Amoebophrya sp., Strain Ameob2" /LENGTH=170 /DNA_ID=CAMNT_0020685153 /DNA_START=464 /DNA_END=976 /DNA_ORIENTATION=-
MAALIPIAAGMCAPGCAGAAASAAATVVGGAGLLSAAPVVAVGAGAAAIYAYMRRGEGDEEAAEDEFQDVMSDDEMLMQQEGGRGANKSKSTTTAHEEQQQNANTKAEPVVRKINTTVKLQRKAMKMGSTPEDTAAAADEDPCKDENPQEGAPGEVSANDSLKKKTAAFL